MRELDRSKVKKRDEIIFGIYMPPEHENATRNFDDLTGEELQKLVDLNVADPDDTHNYAPSISECIEYAKDSPELNFSFGGYVVYPDREDYRVSIDRIIIYPNPKGEEFTIEQVCNIVSAFRYADEFDLTPTCMSAWWD